MLEKKKLLVIIIVIFIAIVAIATVLAILYWPSTPKIPSNEEHIDRTTCFECHQTGVDDAPEFPSSHQEKIEEGELTEDVDDCLECHEREE